KKHEKARKQEKEREREEKERKQKGESKQARAEQRERDRERAREDARERTAAGNGHDVKRRKPGREQPLWRLRGGAEEDDDEVEAGSTSGTASAVFVSTFTDLNNRENGDPVSYIRTTLVDR